MSASNIAFRNRRTELLYNFSGENISSDGGLLLLWQKLKRSGMLEYFSSSIVDTRHRAYTRFESSDLLALRILLLCCGYEDCNDVSHLKHDPALRALFSHLPSQSTLSRFENSMNLGAVYRLAQAMIDYYVDTLDPSRKDIIIDVDCTDDPTHGNQQGSLFHGYYWQYQYNQLFYLDGQTGQVIFPVLRPGNVHSSKWNERFIQLIVAKITDRYPHINIHIRADAGFSGPKFYRCADELNLGFCIGIPSNSRLTSLFEDHIDMVKQQYVDHNIAYQHFVGPRMYQAQSWDQPQDVYAKIESTAKGLNVRFFVSNYEDENPEQLYKEHYVLRGETAENRIKEIKNYCFSDRLSCSRFSANYFRLIVACMSYEILRSIKELLAEVTHDARIVKWNVQSIRLYLIKVAAQVKVTVRRIYFKLARGHPYQNIIDGLLKIA